MHKFNVEKIYQKMIEIANKDGVISSEEQKILDNVRDNIKKYYEVLVNSYEDQVITAVEQDNLYNRRKAIMDEALKVAKEDDTVTQDEFRLLTGIRSIIEDMELHE